MPMSRTKERSGAERGSEVLTVTKCIVIDSSTGGCGWFSCDCRKSHKSRNGNRSQQRSEVNRQASQTWYHDMFSHWISETLPHKEVVVLLPEIADQTRKRMANADVKAEPGKEWTSVEEQRAVRVEPLARKEEVGHLAGPVEQRKILPEVKWKGLQRNILSLHQL